jgi:DNA topoisomerase I
MGLSSNTFTLQKPYELVICEKPTAALRIAQALGTSCLKKISSLEIVEDNTTMRIPSPFFSAIDKTGRHFVICSALGHLYGLVDVGGNRSIYPVFDVKWRPLLKRSNVNGSSNILSEKIENHIKTVSILSHKAAQFIHACDYDQEGEVIGYNILEYACNRKYDKSLRAKFSTLTEEEIRYSFNNLLKPSKRLAYAGLSRHMIDFIYGVNLSRALAQSFKTSNDSKMYCNLSIGRVQGPTLAFVVDKEIEIRNHVAVPYWTITAKFEKNGFIIKSCYQPPTVDSLSKATLIVDACKNRDGKVAEIKTKKIVLISPPPFDLGDLQKEAYRIFKFTPSYTLTIAEKLYLSALISYPRTSSQKLPDSINYRKIISNISKINSPPSSHNNGSTGNNGLYTDLAMKLLSKDFLSPNEGSKIDPAHPAIYPTGSKPKGKLEVAEFKLFDLIVKRFLTTFGEPAILQRTRVIISVKDEYNFKAEGNKVMQEGWMLFYKPYVNSSLVGSQVDLSILHKNDILKNVDITLTNNLTAPPPRFNQSSLLEKMEKEKIGTKATRSEIINTLFKRNYLTTTTTLAITQKKETNDVVSGTGIGPTDIGFEIIQSMRKYVPNIVSTGLTRSMEEQLEDIQSGKTKSTFVIDYAKNKLKEAIFFFKENQNEIGLKISNAVVTTKNKQQVVLGSCPICKKGSLIIKRSSRTKKRFVGCSSYLSDRCTATAPLPQKGVIKVMDKTCSKCHWPLIRSANSTSEKRRADFCLNARCISKTNSSDDSQNRMTKRT